jgi:hypothetical protein
MSSESDPSAPRFSEKELALILHRAAEAQTRSQSGSGYSLAEIQAIASEAGISPHLIEEAAATVRLDQEASPYSTTLRIDRVVQGEVPTADFIELVDIIRLHSDLPGETSTDHGRLEWRATDGIGTTVLTVTPRGGRTRIALRLTPSELLIGAGTIAFISGAFGFFGVALALKAIGAAKATMALGGLVAGGTGLAGGFTIGLRRLGRKWRGRARAVADEIAAAAREAVGRKQP